MTATRAAAALCVAVLLAAGCSTGAAEESASAQPSDRDVAAIASPSASPATPQEAALEAWQSYLAASVDAMAEGNTQSAALAESADGEALRLARRRVRANSQDGVVVTGDLESSTTPTDVEITTEQTQASITDCVLNNLVQTSAEDADEVVREATGWRQPVNATLEVRDGEWTVVSMEVPLEDGSGSVPPPPDESRPFLRGPAQGPAPPSCVPDDIAREAVAGYEAFVDAYDTAIGFGAERADPDLPALAATAVEPQLSAARDFAQSLADDGLVFRGERNAIDPWAVSTADNDDRVIVYSCVKIGRYGQAQATATEPTGIVPDAGTTRLESAEVVRDGESWKVKGSLVLEEGLEGCTSSSG